MLRHLRGRIAHHLRLARDVEDLARDRLRCRDGDRSAAELIEQLRQRRVARQVHREARQRPLDRLPRGVGHAPHLPPVQVAEHHALEHVVDLVRLEVDRDRAVALDVSLVFEVAHAGRVEDHPCDGQAGLPRFRGRVLSEHGRGGGQDDRNEAGSGASHGGSPSGVSGLRRGGRVDVPVTSHRCRARASPARRFRARRACWRQTARSAPGRRPGRAAGPRSSRTAARPPPGGRQR